jgi:hypothetical protein
MYLKTSVDTDVFFGHAVFGLLFKYLEIIYGWWNKLSSVSEVSEYAYSTWFYP